MSERKEAIGRDGSPSRPQDVSPETLASTSEIKTDGSESRPYLAASPWALLLIFALTVLSGLIFALYTNHVWEDYYITYRSSRNLATGHGLVFNLGDRLHTFTSPLGVLLPALANLVTGDHSDAAALWVFRAMSLAALGGAAIFIFACARAAQRGVFCAVLVVGWLLSDAKSLDFSINGMETGVLLLCVAFTLWAQFAPVSRRWLWVGLGWAGIMWTRPDGFLYIALLAAGAWLFNDRNRVGYGRLEWIKTCLLAALVCGVVYLPWFVGAWIYYGTPVPHTIVAKSGLIHGPRTLLGAITTFAKLPFIVWRGNTTLPDAFLPSYYVIGGWPTLAIAVAKGLGFLAAFSWLIPRIGPSARTASLAFCGFQVYLTYVPYFPFPWYQPGAAILGAYALAVLVGEMIRPQPLEGAAPSAPRKSHGADGAAPSRMIFRIAGLALAIALIGSNLWLTPAVARQLAAQQRVVEDGNRRKIGEWLHEHAQPTDTVFMEPLGYIGYFSNLKTYDFPGMSSREMTRAIGDIGPDWAGLIDYLQPNWLVLRPSEIKQVNIGRSSLLDSIYEKAQDFDASPAVGQLDVHGRSLLEVDSHFTVFKRHPFKCEQFEQGLACSLYGSSLTQCDGRSVVMVHAPGYLTVKIPPNAKHATLPCGFLPGAEIGDTQTDGAAFEVRIRDRGHQHPLAWRRIDPHNASDRGLQSIEVDLPSHSETAVLILQTDPGKSSQKDWTVWGFAEYR